MSSSKDNVFDISSMMSDLEKPDEKPAVEEDSAIILTRAKVDSIVGKPPSFFNKQKGRVNAWYDFTTRCGKLAPHHRNEVVAYVVAYWNYRVVTAQLESVDQRQRYTDEFRDYWTNQNRFRSQMLAAYKTIMGESQGGRPRNRRPTDS